VLEALAAHDVLITQLRWNLLEKRVVLLVDDIYASFEGLPEYPGSQPARIICDGVFRIEVDLMTDEFPMKIMDLEIESAESAHPSTFEQTFRLGVSSESSATRLRVRRRNPTHHTRL
jgi:hypothetical protein